MTSPIPLEKRNVSKARRVAVLERQGHVCKRANCDAPAVDVDHIIPLWAGGSNRDDNLEGLCADHHGQKTRAEAKARAKANRIVARETNTRRPRKQIPHRGFGPLTKKFNGEVGPKRSARRETVDD